MTIPQARPRQYRQIDRPSADPEQSAPAQRRHPAQMANYSAPSPLYVLLTSHGSANRRTYQKSTIRDRAMG